MAEQRDELTDRFLASPYVEGLPDRPGYRRMVVESLVTLGIEHSGDPMQWTPAIVELALTSWLADTVAGPPDEVAAAPGVLRAFVRFCHDEREVPASLRDETVDAVDLWRHAYEARIASESDDDLSEHLVQHWWRRIELLAGEVGDVDVLMGLAVAALPDEPFESAAVTTADGDQVSRLVLLCDRACDTLFDVEHRTACRRLLARAARRGSTVFSGRRDERRMAAAVVYAVGIANRSIGSGRSVLVRDVQTHFGIKGSVSDLAAELQCPAVPADGRESAPLHLGSAELLTSAGRKHIIAERDEALVWVRAVATELGREGRPDRRAAPS